MDSVAINVIRDEKGSGQPNTFPEYSIETFVGSKKLLRCQIKQKT